MHPPTRKRWKRRPFLLLEVLLALTLVALLFFPLIRPHLVIEKESKKEFLFEHLTKEADLYFMDFKRQLYEKYHSWDELYKGGEVSIPTKEECPYLLTLEYKRADKKYSHKHNYLLLDVTFTFIPKNNPRQKIPFTYGVFLEKRGEA